MKATSTDLRQCIFSYSLTHTIRETAEVFQVSTNTVCLIKKRFIETGSVSAKTNRYKPPRLITEEGELYLQSLLISQPDITLEQLRTEYQEAYGILVSIGTMYNTVKRLGFTRKKKTYSHPKKTAKESHNKRRLITNNLPNVI